MELCNKYKSLKLVKKINTLGFILNNFQESIVHNENEFTVYNEIRQSGKTLGILMDAISICESIPNSKVLICVRTSRSKDYVIHELRRYYNKKHFSSRRKIVLDNNSEIEFHIYNNENSLRGYSLKKYNTIYFDDCFIYIDQVSRMTNNIRSNYSEQSKNKIRIIVVGTFRESEQEQINMQYVLPTFQMEYQNVLGGI